MKKKKAILAVLGLWVLLLAGAIILFIPADNVSAFSSDGNEKNNIIKTGEHTTGIEENFNPPESVQPDTTYDKIVAVKNYSNIPCYVRILVESDQEELSLNINFDTENWTEKQDDGYYYYRTVLGGRETTKPLFTTVTTGKEDKEFRILVYEETVQAEGHKNVWDAFASIQGEQESDHENE